MSTLKYDVLAIGNAIVDILGRCDDAFLARHGAPKGNMRLVDAETVVKLYGAMGPGTEISGGSAANTVVGVASFGGRAAFIGKVADDEFGRIFAHDIKAAGVAFETVPATAGLPTSRSLILVTPDGQRTMNTFLGISTAFDKRDIDAGMIAASKVVYLEGYLFDGAAATVAFHDTAAIAAKAGRQVALTLSDGFCVDRHRDAFRAFIKERVDILFANEGEITSLYRSDFETAARHAASDVKVAVLTRSEKGGVILADGARHAVPAHPVATVVDTTGAGDLYAAGFLYGHTAGFDPVKCGRLAGLAAAEILGHIGARPQVSLQALAKQNGLL